MPRPGQLQRLCGEFCPARNSSEVELQEWKEAIGRAFFTCSCTDGEQGLCAHEATVLLHWERERGSFRFRQTEEERLAAEKQRRRVPQPPPPLALAETIPQAIPMPVPAQSVKRVPASEIVSIAPFFSDITLPEDLYFPLKDILADIQIDSRTLTRAQTLLPQVNPSMLTVKVDYGTNSYQELEAKAQLPGGDVSIHLYPHSLCKATCQICHANFYENRSKKKPVLCEHEAVALHLLCDHIIRYRPGDATDRSGNLLLREIGNLQHTQKDQADTRYAGISIHLGVRQDRDKLLLIALYREPTGKLQEIPFPSAMPRETAGICIFPAAILISNASPSHRHRVRPMRFSSTRTCPTHSVQHGICLAKPRRFLCCVGSCWTVSMRSMKESLCLSLTPNTVLRASSR